MPGTEGEMKPRHAGALFLKAAILVLDGEISVLTQEGPWGVAW